MWKEWLSFSRTERYGIILLLSLVLILAIIPYIHRTFFISSSPLANPQVFSKIDSFVLTLNQPKSRVEQPFSYIEEEKPPVSEPELFNFDPNTVTASQLIRLGLSKKQARVIENYRSKGGIFRKAEDFSKIYIIDSTLFNRLLPFIQIDKSQFEHKNLADDNTITIIKAEVLQIELNSADTLELVKIRGIGRGYARRIIAYRNLLGGYYNANQLTEVYGFTKETLESISPNIYIDSLKIKKININLVDYNELKKHPYLSDYQARAIIYYRETIGPFQSAKEIASNKLVDDKTFQKLRHYITVN